MTINELKNELNQGSFRSNYDLHDNVKNNFEGSDLFKIHCDLLKSKNKALRFYALHQISHNYQDFLRDGSEKIVNIFYPLLFDSFDLVVDRSTWALSTIGDKALNRLIKEYHKGNLKTRQRITFAVGRGNINFSTKEKFELLLLGLKSSNKEFKFTSMCEVMSNSPVSPWNKSYDCEIDFEEIYSIIYPIALNFSKSQNKSYCDFGTRYIEWIDQNENK